MTDNPSQGNIASDEVSTFLRDIVAKLTPAAIEVVQRKESGNFEIHFGVGKFTRARKIATL